MFNNFFSWKSCHLWDNVEEYCTAKQATDYNIICCVCLAWSYHTPEAATTVFNCSWGWTQKASETCRVLLQLLINILPSCITLVFYIYYTLTTFYSLHTRKMGRQHYMTYEILMVATIQAWIFLCCKAMYSRTNKSWRWNQRISLTCWTVSTIWAR